MTVQIEGGKIGTGQSARRGRRRAQVLSAATRLLEADLSYTELSVEQVLRESRISRATFYAHFRNKSELLSALAEDVIDDMIASAKPWWSGPDRPEEPALVEAVTDITAAYLKRHAIMAAVVEVATYDPGVRAQLDLLVGRTIRELARHIRDSQALGIADQGLDPDRTAGWIVWMCERGLYTLVRGADDERRRRLIAAWVHIIWGTLYGGAA
jgi:AcrR family transcriptional regulator